MIPSERAITLGCLAALLFAYLLVSFWDADIDTRTACAKAWPDSGSKPPAGSSCEFYWKEGEGT